jgi:hypothetical protein
MVRDAVSARGQGCGDRTGRRASQPSGRSAGHSTRDPWSALLEAGAALLQGLASTRAAAASSTGAPPLAIERDPVTGQASLRLPLPDEAVLQKLAKAFEPWLR